MQYAKDIAKLTPDITFVFTEAKALQDIIFWSARRPLWQRDALRRLCQKGSLEEADYVELLEICKTNPLTALPIASEHAPAPEAASSHIYLRRIHSVEHVNALAAEQTLLFEKGSGITVIYGDNGSGKSGYARILKSACRARLNEELKILPNIYASGAGTPKAKIDFSVNGQNRSADWAFRTACDPTLSAVSVFDSATANIHVDKQNEVAYNPYPLELLKQLSDTTKEIQCRLNLEIETLENQTPQSLKAPKHHQGTQVYDVTSKLTAKTDISKIQSLATLTEEEAKAYETLKADLANDPEATARKVRNTKTKIEQGALTVQSLAEAIASTNLQQVQALYKDYVAKQAAAVAAAENLFRDEKLAQVGSESWRVLWEAARKYSDGAAYPDKTFPHTAGDAHCVLCHQELSEDAAKRLHSFEHFVQDETKQQEKNAKNSLHVAIDALVKKSPALKLVKEMQEILEELGKSSLAEDLRQVIIQGKWRLRAFLNNMDAGIDMLPPLINYPEERITALLAGLDIRISTLTAEKDSEARKQANKKLLELEDRKWLAIVKDDAIAQVGRIKSMDALRKLVNDNKTTAITAKSSELAKYLVTDALCAQFSKEVDKLDLGKLAIELVHSGTRQGSPLFKVALERNPDAKVSAVLSEGEFRCIALAAFLAEQATTASKSTVVFDDPVCSLDHMHREQVAKRLAEEANSRQVVIFTHDLAFLFLLEEACYNKGASIAYRWVSRNDETTGFCENNAPPKAQKVPDVLIRLQKRLDNVKQFYVSGNMTKWQHEVYHFQHELRLLWERAVEDAVSPVVSRFKNKVKTAGLAKLTAITKKDCELMREAYGRCSKLLHNESERLNSPLPKPEVIQAEINIMKTWIQQISDCQAKV
jgi:ABC-type transport system involved in cytochrome c biogenesis ATPase subunit